MVWRSVVISKPSRLRREHYSLRIEQEETASVPFEDIAVIVLHHREITLTHPVLAACGEYGISLFLLMILIIPKGYFCHIYSIHGLQNYCTCKYNYRADWSNAYGHNSSGKYNVSVCWNYQWVLSGKTQTAGGNNKISKKTARFYVLPSLTCQ